MTLVTFSEPWGFVANSRDERDILKSFRDSLVMFGFIGRWRGFRDNFQKIPFLPSILLPKPSDDSGAGFLNGQADEQVTLREKMVKEEGYAQEKPDFLQ